MWRILTGIGRGLRSVRPSQCCPQDCSDEAPNYHLYNDEVSKVHAATLQHYTTSSSWSPLMVTRYDKLLKQVAFGVVQSEKKAIHTRLHENGGPWVTGSNNKYYRQTCPPWHWHALQDNKALDKCCSEKEEKRKEEEDKEDWGNTWHYQEWKEVLQASPTLHTIGLGSAAALTLCLYRGWNENCLCPYHAKGKHQTHNGANKQHNLKNKHAAEEEEKNEELLWSNCRTFKHFCNSQEASSEAPDKNYNGVTYEVASTVIYKPDKESPDDAEGLIVPVYSLKKNFLDQLTSFINVQGNLESKNKIQDIYEDEGPFHDESELPFPPQRDKPDVNVRTDSGCMSDLQDFQSQTTIDSGTKDQYSESAESNTNRTLSLLGTARNVSAESELQADLKYFKTEHSEVSRVQKEPDNSCIDDTKVKDLHDRLLEVVIAHREDQLQEIFKKDGKTLSDTKPEEAVVYFQAGVMVGDSSSTFNLALCYHMGYGIMQDFEKARKLYEAAAAAGHGWAIYNLAVMVSQGLGGPCDHHRVHSLLQQAAKIGVTEAMEALSILEVEKQEQSIACEAEPQLRKCYSEPSLHSSLTNQLSYSYSTDDLQSLLDEDVWTDSDLSTGAICQQN